MIATSYSIPRDVEAAGESTVLFFIDLMENNGNDVRFAEMLALRQFPAIMTDDVAVAGMETISHMFEKDPAYTARLCRIAQAKGYKPKPSDVYMTSIANAEGDPAAFVNHGQGRGHIKKVLQSRGMAGEGLVKVDARQPESDPYENPHHKLHPKIVERIRKRKLKENPELAHGNQAEIRADITAKHGLS